jgi:hypothetical protein
VALSVFLIESARLFVSPKMAVLPGGSSDLREQRDTKTALHPIGLARCAGRDDRRVGSAGVGYHLSSFLPVR